VIAEYDNFGALTAKYLYGNGIRLVKIDGSGNKFYLHTDQLGSTRVVTNAYKATVQTFSYYPFGEVLTTTGTNTDYKFNGKEFDEEQGVNLYYYGARYYDPKIGRFISIDPIVNYTNPYSYVRNNPINLTDPSGMDPIGGWSNYKANEWEGGSPGDLIGRPLGRPGIPNLSLPTGSAEGGGRYVNKLWLASFRLWALHFLEAGNPGPNLGPLRRDPFDVRMDYLNENEVVPIIEAGRDWLIYQKQLSVLEKEAEKYGIAHPNPSDEEKREWAKKSAEATGLPEYVILALIIILPKNWTEG